MMQVEIPEYPRAVQAALDIHKNGNFSFPLNDSAVLEDIRTHKIYDVSPTPTIPAL